MNVHTEKNSLDQPLRLIGKASVPGPATWDVELIYDPLGKHSTSQASDVAKTDLITDNNRQQVQLELIDRPIRVLYVEGYPRWDYRYLKSVIVREKSIRSSVLLISADREFAQEGDVPITRLPRDIGELKEFDVVVIGDVPSGYFSLSQRTLLRDHIAIGGAGLLWIGGAYHTPYSYDTTQLADLLPMRRPGMVAPVENTFVPIQAQPTPLAQSLNLFVLHEPVTTNDLRTSSWWPEGLPSLMWAQEIGALKPSADVLVTGLSEGEGSQVPLVAQLRYGAGQVVYVASDDTWRWRYGRGDLYFQRFWVELIRMLGRHRVRDDSRRVRLDSSHHRVEVNQAVVIEAHVRDAMLLERDLPQMTVSVTNNSNSINGNVAKAQERLELLPVTTPHHEVTHQDKTRTYRAIWRPSVPGQMVLKLSEPAQGDLDTALSIEVFRRNDEMQHPLPDHAKLKELADLSGGQIVELNHLEQLAGLIPNRAKRTPNDLQEPLWNSPLTLIIVLALLTIEWIGRKIIRLA